MISIVFLMVVIALIALASAVVAPSATFAELDTKREQLAKMFKDKEVIGADGAKTYGFSAEELVEVNKRNDELGELNDKWEKERSVLVIAETNDRLLKEGRQPVNTPRQPTDGPGREAQKESWARQFVKSKAFTAAVENRQLKGVTVDLPDAEFKTLMTTTAGYAPFVPRIDRVEMYPDRRVMIGSLMPSIPTEDAAIKYMEETTRTNNSAATAEGSAFGESALVYTERTVPIEDLGGWIPVTERQLEDVPGLEALIGMRLSYMVDLNEEDESVNGSGSSPHLQGFLNKSGVQTQARGSDPWPDAILKGMTKVRGVTAGTGFAEPSAVVQHPTDWQNIQLMRTADGIYIWGHPSGDPVQRIWGKPVCATPVIAQGTSLLGDFEMYAAMYRKKGIRIAITDSHDVYFVSNKYAIKAYKRAALTIFRPSAFCTITGM